MVLLPQWGSPSPSPSCLSFGKAACVPPGRLTELPLVKLYLVFLFHLPIESLSVNDPPDVLDRQKCLTALASLRHAKWFQVWLLSLFVFKTNSLSLVLCCMFFCLLFGHSVCVFILCSFFITLLKCTPYSSTLSGCLVFFGNLCHQTVVELLCLFSRFYCGGVVTILE